MDIETLTATIVATSTALAALLAALTPIWLRIRKQLALLTGRKSLSITILTDKAGTSKALDFAALLERTGYPHVSVTRAASSTPLSTGDRREVVLLWSPDPATVESQIEEVLDINPRVQLMIYTQDRMPFMPSDERLVSNMSHRLRADLAILAEG